MEVHGDAVRVGELGELRRVVESVTGEVMDVLMPQLGETVAEGKIIEMVQVGRRRREAGRQPVRDRDRQGVDGSAGDQRRRACGDPRARGRGRAGGRGGRGHLRSAAEGRKRAARSPLAQRARKTPSAAARASSARSRFKPQERQAPIALEPFREVRTPERNFGPARHPAGVTVTPLARRLAGEAGIDLSRLTGSGPHGRIVARDVEARSRAPRPRRCLPAVRPHRRSVKALYRDVPYEEVPLDGMRKTIAARLLRPSRRSRISI